MHMIMRIICFIVPYCRTHVLNVEKKALLTVAVAMYTAHNNTMMVPMDVDVKEVLTQLILVE